MAYGKIKTEHGGPKRGNGAWAPKAEAKQAAKKIRRLDERKVVAEQVAA